ncbi:5-histidylcysteine sulfoxide synthase [Pseudoalteromonas sp. A22]|uniref:5-histidylcysteine sulfoxide synthase n=1 Tax=Pseudoalteromonas TaxID=53246 RepID=UPI001BA9CA49|nr:MULTISPECIES: 5-histidylcysteine sulfoxide synthase [Pseudoalteromonas]QUI63942.1 5-histidylcysteine sulfoxide synthase [Pseudoalteromonas sp. A22]USE69647.1 SAM-dependent methyltransferase [Pseudoalteromonas flavipulchra]
MERPNTLKPIWLSGGDVEKKRAKIKAYFNNSWQQYESLFSNINNDDAYFVKAERLRHPLIFYFGHTACFYVNKLMLGKYITQRVNPHIESTCAVGVDEMSWDDLDSNNYDWPTVPEVRAYRQQVNALINGLIDEMDITLPITQDSLAWVVLMGIEHERIHLETSSVIMRMLPLADLTLQPGWEACDEYGDTPDNNLISVSGCNVRLGKPESNQTYGWDNEYGVQDVKVAPFKASKYVVSNQEFLTFVEAGGYNQPEFWTAEGQAWLASTKSTMPRFWVKKDTGFWQRNLAEEIPLPLNWPVEVNYLEAKAFCNWKSEQSELFVRLPTEAEWQVLRDKLDVDLPTWSEAPGNINLEVCASSCPVNRFETEGLFDIIGNVWQWTESPIDAYSGFKVHPLYDDFSTPTFDGKHNLIKGGSWISTGNEAVRDSRYAFRRHFFQHAGFRYIESESPQVPVQKVNLCEMDADVANALHSHYGKPVMHFGNPLQSVVSQLMVHYQGNTDKALDLGCSVGRASFELAKHFAQVDGIDFTARNIQHALALKEGTPVRFATEIEGEIVDFHEVSTSQLGFNELSERIHFCQGDGHNLKPQFAEYDLILCHRVVEYLYSPKTFLNQIKSRLNAGGILAISSAYQWDKALTQAQNWLGGYKVSGENVTGRDGLEILLGRDFELLAEDEVMSAISKNARKVELERCQLTLWRLK